MLALAGQLLTTAAGGEERAPGGPTPQGAAAALNPILPDGFSLEQQPAGYEYGELTDFVVLPLGGILATGKSGTVRFVPPGSASREVTTTPPLEVYTDIDSGLSSLDLAPDYATTGHVYLTYTYERPDTHKFSRLSRWTVDDPDDPRVLADEVVLLDDIQVNDPVHNIGTVRVAGDGTLFVSVGDSALEVDPQAVRAQDLDDPHGKLLRITPDGLGVESNPFYDADAPGSWRSRVWAYGLRMPFRFTLHPESGVPLIGDVGLNTYEELDSGAPGANFGWPCWEGPIRTPEHENSAVCQDLYTDPAFTPTAPTWSYPRTSASGHGSITAGVFADSATYPEEYRDAYFFGDFAREILWTAEIDAAGEMIRPPEAGADGTGSGTFGLWVGWPVSFRLCPGGDVCFAEIKSGSVWRLRYGEGNRQPVAVATADVDAGTRTVRFHGSASYDQDGDALTFAWEFGDGTTSTAADPVHTYAAGGDYTVELVVSDGDASSAPATLVVNPANAAPELTLSTPGADATFAVDEPVSLSATATDAEDGTLSGSAIAWMVLLEHCPTADSCHTHPSSAGTGSSLTLPFHDHGENVTMTVRATAVDGDGQETTRSYVATPRRRSLTLQSLPAGVPLEVDGQHVTTIELTEGNTVQLSAPETHGDTLRFHGWSHARPRTHRFVVPAADTTLTASYELAEASVWQRLPDGAASAPGAATWGPNRTDLFAVGDAGTLVHMWWLGGQEWHPEGPLQDLGAPPGLTLVDAPAVASRTAGQLNVVARASDDAVWHRWYVRGRGWSSWERLGGIVTSAPSAATWSQQHLSVFARGRDGALWHRDYTTGTGWTGWRSAGGIATSAPGVASRNAGDLEVVVRGRDDALWHRTYARGGWSSWQRVGGALRGGGRPTVVAETGGNEANAFVIGTNGLLYRHTLTAGGWSDDGFTRVGGPPGTLLQTGTAAITRAGSVEVYARDTDGRLWRRAGG